MNLLKKILIKYEGEAFHNMSRETWKKFKLSEDNNVTSSLIWGCAALVIFNIILLIVLLADIIKSGIQNSSFLLGYHICLLAVFSTAIIFLNIQSSKKRTPLLNKINYELILSILALSFSVIYTIYQLTLNGHVIVYAAGLVFCVYFLRERPLINTLIYLISLFIIIAAIFVFIKGPLQIEDAIINSSLIAVMTIVVSRSIFKYRINNYYTNARLNLLVTKDTLTGLNNRFSYNEYIDENKIVYPAVVCVLDMDNLKIINDTSGHLEGDKCLMRIAKSLIKAFEFSFLARTGGDEFVVIIGDTTIKDTLPKIKKFRNLISAKTKNLKEISVSLGYCRINKNSSYNSAFIKAEHMMYKEKARKKQR